MAKTNQELIREFFANFGEYYDVPALPELKDIERLDYTTNGAGNRFGGMNYRLTFADETVSDWRIQFDADEVIDAYEFNQVI